MKLFTYRGKRVHAFHRNIKGILHGLSGGFPFLLVFAYYVYLHFEQLKVHPLLRVISLERGFYCLRYFL